MVHIAKILSIFWILVAKKRGSFSSILYTLFVPNWCYNELVVEGSEKYLMRFFAEAARGEDPLLLSSLIEPPDETLEALLDYWGTPAEIEESKVQLLPLSHEEEKAHYALVYSFYTPWGPPDVWTERVSALFPELDFYLRYGISEIDIASILSARAGEVDRENEAFYHEVFPD